MRRASSMRSFVDPMFLVMNERQSRIRAARIKI